jgi:hypothetical protein
MGLKNLFRKTSSYVLLVHNSSTWDQPFKSSVIRQEEVNCFEHKCLSQLSFPDEYTTLNFM